MSLDNDDGNVVAFKQFKGASHENLLQTSSADNRETEENACYGIIL